MVRAHGCTVLQHLIPDAEMGDGEQRAKQAQGQTLMWKWWMKPEQEGEPRFPQRHIDFQGETCRALCEDPNVSQEAHGVLPLLSKDTRKLSLD